MVRRFLITVFALLIAVLASADEWTGGGEYSAPPPSVAATPDAFSGNSPAALVLVTTLRGGAHRLDTGAPSAFSQTRAGNVVDAETLIVPHVAVLAAPVCHVIVPPTLALVAHAIETRGPPPVSLPAQPHSPRAPPAA